MSKPQEQGSKWEVRLPAPWRLIPNLGLPSAMIPVAHVAWFFLVVLAWILHREDGKLYAASYVLSASLLHYILRSLAGLSGQFPLSSDAVRANDFREIVAICDSAVLILFLCAAVEVFAGPGTLAGLMGRWL